MKETAPAVLWTKQFSIALSFGIAASICGLPFMFFASVSDSHSPYPRFGQMGMVLSVAGFFWMTWQCRKQRYTITSECIEAEISHVERLKSERIVIPLSQLILVSVQKPQRRGFSKLVIYDRGKRKSPLQLGLLSAQEVDSAVLILRQYCEVTEIQLNGIKLSTIRPLTPDGKG